MTALSFSLRFKNRKDKFVFKPHKYYLWNTFVNGEKQTTNNLATGVQMRSANTQLPRWVFVPTFCLNFMKELCTVKKTPQKDALNE